MTNLTFPYMFITVLFCFCSEDTFFFNARPCSSICLINKDGSILVVEAQFTSSTDLLKSGHSLSEIQRRNTICSKIIQIITNMNIYKISLPVFK